MATRGAVGILLSRKPLKWIGVYHHWDSYPEGLLRALVEEVLPSVNFDLTAAVKKVILEHPGGWSHLFKSGVCEADPTSPSGWRYNANANMPQCYCHGYFVERDGFHSGLMVGCDCQDGKDEPECDPLFIEWVYLFDLARNSIVVLASRRSREGRYRHFRVGEFKVSPDMAIDYGALQKRGFKFAK